MLAVLRWINLPAAGFAVTPLMAHVLELPNKMRLDGPLWLAIQQTLYQGWGPVFGPVEIVALLTSIALVYLRYRHGRPTGTTIAAALAYVVMLAVFFVFNSPVNAAVSTWTAATLPPDWPDYRLRWESGHALSAILSVAAFICLLHAWMRDRSTHPAERRD